MCAGRHALGWLFHGYAPGLMVTNLYRPSASVRHLPAPVKLGSDLHQGLTDRQAIAV
jgi:hypothetical protein